MVRNVTISVLLHGVLLGLAYFGLPFFSPVPAPTEVPILVELVSVAQQTNIPTKPKEPVAKAKPTPAPPPKPPPPPAPRGALKAPPKPDRVAELPKEKAAVALHEDVTPKKRAKPEAKKSKPKKSASQALAPAPLPPRRPKAPDQFSSVLKTLEELQKAPQKKPTKKSKRVKKQVQDFTKLMANALKSDRQRTDIGPKLTISEIDLVRQQIHKCWNLPAGAKDAQNMQISIRIGMNPDGTVRTARILNAARMSSDPFYRTMAESALRAVLNPMCQPFKLPPEKYERWKSMKLNFDPREMFGL